MSVLHGLRARLRSLLFRRSADQALAEEIRFHLEMETERLIREGLPGAEARRRARLEFGGVDRYMEEARDGRHLGWVEDVWRDIRLAVRDMLRRPGLAGAAVISIAVGIGLTATVFAVLNATFYKRLAVPGADRLVAVYVRHGQVPFGAASYPEYAQIRDHARMLDGVTAFANMGMRGTVRVAGSARQREIGVVASNFFDVLRLRPELGRFFAPGEDSTSGGAAVAVVSDRFWRRELGADPGVIGRRIAIERRPFTIIGVAPEGFIGPTPGWGIRLDLYIPMSMRTVLAGGGARIDLGRAAPWGVILGRMRPGVGLPQIRAELSGFAARLAAAYPKSDSGRTFDVEPHRGVRPDIARSNLPMLLALLGVVLVALLISCVNMAGLLLVRVAARRREMGIRLSLGAGRAVLLRALLAESLLLALLGGVGGALLSLWGTQALRALLMTPVLIRLHAYFDLAPDLRVLSLALAAAFVCGLLAGLLPALWSTRTALLPALRGETRAGGAVSATARATVVVQVALAVLLLTAADVFLSGLHAALDMDPGFRAAGIRTSFVQPRGPGYDSLRTARFYAELLQRVRAAPGIEAAELGTTDVLGFGGRPVSIGLPDEPAPRHGAERTAAVNYVTPGLLGMLGIRLLRGRPMKDVDRRKGPGVAEVDAGLARRLWPGGDPVGKRLLVDGRELEVVGVVADAKYLADSAPSTPYLFAPFTQRPNLMAAAQLHVRTASGDPGIAAAAIEQALASIDPDVPFSEPVPLTEGWHEMLSGTRIIGGLASTSAVLALLLATVGLFALLAYSVSTRTREIGVRMALGARAADVRRRVVWQGITLIAAGVAIGVPAGLAAWRLLRGLVSGVGRVDGVGLASVILVLVAVAVAATWIPARRAARVDPMVVLRAE